MRNEEWNVEQWAENISFSLSLLLMEPLTFKLFDMPITCGKRWGGAVATTVVEELAAQTGTSTSSSLSASSSSSSSDS